MWLTTPAEGEAVQIQYEFDKTYCLHQMWVWNYNVSIENLVGFGVKDVTVEYSTDGAEWTVLDDVEVAQAPGAATCTADTVVDFDNVVAQYVRLTVNSGWGTWGQYGLSEVRFFYVPMRARDAAPTSDATGQDVALTLSWRAGRQATQHNVYVDTDQQAVTNGTGSTVGYLVSPFAETAIARGGKQSMPVTYENVDGVTVSETTRILNGALDWSQYGVQSLSLCFFGDLDDGVGELYVEIGGTKVVYDGSAEDVKIAAWIPWVIDLAGLDIASVDTLTIGVEGSDISGLLLIDDIRAYPYAGELMEVADSGEEGLVAYYPLDGDAGDAAGDHDGTIVGEPDFVTGIEGQALDLTTSEYVTVAYAEGLGLNTFTVAAWVNVEDLSSSRGILGTRHNSDNTFDLKVESTRVHADIGDGNSWINTNVDIDAAHGGVVSIGDWRHIAYAIDAVAGTAELYVDGVLATTITVSGTPLLMDTDQELRIGNASGSEYMMGMIDEVRIYNRVLSEAEVAGLAGRPGPFYASFQGNERASATAVSLYLESRCRGPSDITSLGPRSFPGAACVFPGHSRRGGSATRPAGWAAASASRKRIQRCRQYPACRKSRGYCPFESRFLCAYFILWRADARSASCQSAGVTTVRWERRDL